MRGEQVGHREKAREPKLEALVAQARRVAAAVRESVRADERDRVGPRELFIAAAMKSPHVVAEAARRGGIHVRRLVVALEEWPVKEVAPAQVEGVTLSPAARSLVTAAARGKEQGCWRLVERLLDPEALPPAGNAAEDAGPEPDATAKVLSRLGLI